MKFFIDILFTVSLLILSSQGVILHSTHTEVEPLQTHNVSLECSLSDLKSSDLFLVSSIRIFKFQNGPKPWQPVVEILDRESSPRVLRDLGFSTIGNIVETDESVPENSTVRDDFLKITWALANKDTLGRYRCDVIGFKEDYSVVWEQSSIADFIIPPKMTARDVYEILMRQKGEMESKIDEQQNKIESGFMSKLQEAVDTQYNETKELERKIEQKLSVMTEIQLLLLTGFLEYWPEGTYGLPRPLSNCPANIGVTWEASWRKHHTESNNRNYDELSENNHFETTNLYRSGTDNFIYQHFCMVTTRSVGPLWPKGSYCIARYSDCPEGFSYGYVHWEDENSNSDTNGKLPVGSYGNAFTQIYFCCRSDGPASTPIYLPKSKPFYLYRYNGTCQRVVGMDVKEEYIFFDTDDSGQSRVQNNFHPDGTFGPNVQLQFCYYENSQTKK